LQSAIGLACTFAPQQLWGALGSTEVINITEASSQVYGIYAIIAAAATYRLAVAAQEDSLFEPLYRRLNTYLGLFTAVSAAPLVKGIITGDLQTLPAGAAAAALLMATAATYYPALRAADSDALNLRGLLEGSVQGLKDTSKAGRGLTGAFYSLNFWEALILGVALLGGPILPTVAGQISGSTIVLKELVGAGTILYAGTVWLLLDASDKGDLGNPTIKTLNLACGAVAALVALSCVLGQANGVPINATNQAVVLISCGATAAVYTYLGLKPPSSSSN
jgi:hypothetical protein